MPAVGSYSPLHGFLRYVLDEVLDQNSYITGKQRYFLEVLSITYKALIYV